MTKKETEITRHDIMAIRDRRPLKCSAPGPWTKGRDPLTKVFLLGLGRTSRFETISEASKHAASHGRRIKVTLY